MSDDVSQAARFELCSGESWRDPWGMYAALREHDPVHHVVPAGRPDEDYYVLSRYSDVYDAVRDPETFSSAQGLTVDYNNLSEIGLGENRPFVFTDPPEHTEFRRRVARGFTPRQVQEISPAVREFVIERIERLRAAGGGDITAELFKPLPTMVVAHYLGVPEEDREKFDGWSEAIVAAAGTLAAEGVLGAQAAVTELMGYFTTLIERRRTAPGDDTVSHLVASGLGTDGDVGGILQILGFAFTMITGGNDTTTGNLGGAVQLLTRHPGQRQRLLDDPGLIPGSVDEFLRLTSPVQGLARTTTRGVELDGGTIPADRRVLLLYASANHDEREYGSDAGELDVTRNPRNILTFGNGNHHCLGSAAARMQATIALTELLARCPEFTVDIDQVRYTDGSYVRWPVSVPFRAA